MRREKCKRQYREDIHTSSCLIPCSLGFTPCVTKYTVNKNKSKTTCANSEYWYTLILSQNKFNTRLFEIHCGNKTSCMFVSHNNSLVLTESFGFFGLYSYRRHIWCIFYMETPPSTLTIKLRASLKNTWFRLETSALNVYLSTLTPE